MTPGKKIGIVVAAAGLTGLASWYFLIYRPNHPKPPKPGDAPPPADPNQPVFNTPSTPQATPWSQIKVGDTLRAVGEVRLYDKAVTSSGAKVVYTAKDGELVGKVYTKGDIAATVKNSMSGSTNPMYLASIFKVRKAY